MKAVRFSKKTATRRKGKPRSKPREIDRDQPDIKGKEEKSPILETKDATDVEEGATCPKCLQDFEGYNSYLAHATA